MLRKLEKEELIYLQKTWRPSAFSEITERHVRKDTLVEALPNLYGKIECASWNRVKLIPAFYCFSRADSRFMIRCQLFPASTARFPKATISLCRLA
jgi:hypothetical protein